MQCNCSCTARPAVRNASGKVPPMRRPFLKTSGDNKLNEPKISTPAQTKQMAQARDELFNDLHTQRQVEVQDRRILPHRDDDNTLKSRSMPYASCR